MKANRPMNRFFKKRFLHGMPIIFVSLFFLGNIVHATEVSSPGSSGYVEALLGVGMLNNNGGTNFTYGVGCGYKLNPNWSVGADFTYNSFVVPSPLTSNLTLALANIKYYFGSGWFGGVKIGSGTVSYSGTGAQSSSTNLTSGPTIGYDCAFSEHWSVGGETSLLWVNNSNPGVSVFQVLANMKYVF